MPVVSAKKAMIIAQSIQIKFNRFPPVNDSYKKRPQRLLSKISKGTETALSYLAHGDCQSTIPTQRFSAIG
jgi:hypothetical protein